MFFRRKKRPPVPEYQKPKFSPYEGVLKIHTVRDKPVQSGKAIVSVQKLRSNGVRFETDLDFPVREDVIYQFCTKTFGIHVEFYGIIQYKIQKRGKRFEYEMTFQKPPRKANRKRKPLVG